MRGHASAAWFLKVMPMAALPIAMVTMLVACSRQQPRFPVRGTVQLDGQPMATGEAHFKIPATGTIERLIICSGSFQGDVAAAGPYQVEIYLFQRPAISVGEGATLDPVARAAAEEQVNVVAPTPGLTAEVKSDAENNFSFSVESVSPRP